METSQKVGCIIQSVLSLVMIVGAFLTYDAKSALLVFFILSGLNFLASLVGLIPIAGVVGYWFISKKLVFAKFFVWFPEIEPTWLTTVIFWSGFVVALSMTIVVIAAIVNKNQ